MAQQNLSTEAIQARIRILKALNIAIKETKNLNKLLDEMHLLLESNATKKAA